jgi:hypothetical protein
MSPSPMPGQSRGQRLGQHERCVRFAPAYVAGRRSVQPTARWRAHLRGRRVSIDMLVDPEQTPSPHPRPLGRAGSGLRQSSLLTCWGVFVGSTSVAEPKSTQPTVEDAASDSNALTGPLSAPRRVWANWPISVITLQPAGPPRANRYPLHFFQSRQNRQQAWNNEPGRGGGSVGWKGSP